MENRAIINFIDHQQGASFDLDVPLDISGHELVLAIQKAFNLPIEAENMPDCYLAAENPIALIRGNKSLEMLKIRDGSIIHYKR